MEPNEMLLPGQLRSGMSGTQMLQWRAMEAGTKVVAIDSAHRERPVLNPEVGRDH